MPLDIAVLVLAETGDFGLRQGRRLRVPSVFGS
jgi:hypothetical protein